MTKHTNLKSINEYLQQAKEYVPNIMESIAAALQDKEIVFAKSKYEIIIKKSENDTSFDDIHKYIHNADASISQSVLSMLIKVNMSNDKLYIRLKRK